MKRLLTIVFFFFVVLLSFDCFAVWVKGYYRKDGTYVLPHYRSAPHSGGGYGGGYYALPAAAATGTMAASSASSETIPHEKLEATPAQNSALNQKWLEYYKSAAMIVGDFQIWEKWSIFANFRKPLLYGRRWKRIIPFAMTGGVLLRKSLGIMFGKNLTGKLTISIII